MSIPIAYSPVARLELTFAALGIPIIGDSFNQFATPPTITVQYAPQATQAQINQGNSLLATWDMRNYTTRGISDLITALQGLTSTQQANIASDLFGGSPMKVLNDLGGNNAALFVLFYVVQTGGTTPSDKNLAKLYAAAMYVQDNPAYLINPAFDTSINVPGWTPIG